MLAAMPCRIEIGRLFELLAACAVVALIGPAMEQAIAVKLVHHVLHLLHVKGAAGAHEDIVSHVESVEQRPEFSASQVEIGLRRKAHGPCGLCVLLAVLVAAGGQQRGSAEPAALARKNVGDDTGEGMAQVRWAVHVIDGRGEIGRHARS